MPGILKPVRELFWRYIMSPWTLSQATYCRKMAEVRTLHTIDRIYLARSVCMCGREEEDCVNGFGHLAGLRRARPISCFA